MDSIGQHDTFLRPIFDPLAGNCTLYPTKAQTCKACHFTLQFSPGLIPNSRIAMSTALVIVDGALVPFVEIDGLLQKEMQTTIQECTLTDAGILNSAQSGIGKVLYCLSTPLSMQQLTQLFKMLSPGAEVLFHSVDQVEGDDDVACAEFAFVDGRPATQLYF